MAMEEGLLNEALKTNPFWSPIYPEPAIVEIESIFLTKLKFYELFFGSIYKSSPEMKSIFLILFWSGSEKINWVPFGLT